MRNATLAETLASLKLGPEIRIDNLVMLPLIGALDTLEPAYLTLDDSMAAGWTMVTEVSEQGRVPELKVVNGGPRPTLIIDGEELLGAKQNRIVNLTILVPAASELTSPVSCVEAGRWASKSRAFAPAPRTQYASGRAKRMEQVTRSIRSSGARMSDQSEVWADIAEKSHRMHASSPTSAMEAIFRRHGGSIDRFVESCRPAKGQVGALFAIGGRIAGVELFDSAITCHKLLPKIVRSYTIDAIDRSDEPASNGTHLRAAADQFLAAVAASDSTSAPAVGIGTDVRLTGAGLTGGALIVDGVVVHASVLTA
jgi:hypothetical protein